MVCFSFIVSTLVAVWCSARFARGVVSVAKPSATQVKYLDYEIGASIHFNMQTFERSMGPGNEKVKPKNILVSFNYECYSTYAN